MYEELAGRTAIITGGGGAICGEIAMCLARHGARIAICDISREAAERRASEIASIGGEAIGCECDALDAASVEAALAKVIERFGGVDILINGAGGSRKEATTSEEQSFFDITPGSVLSVLALNYLSAVVPSQIVGKVFADNGAGVILNISSIAGLRPLTRSVGYSTGKAALNSFTQWLAVHFCEEYSPGIRVNAIAPGFMLTAQNHFLLVDERTGEQTPRGRKILSSVPMRRYGEPSEVAGAALWLVSDSASFVTGAVIPVDGGFTAHSGV